MIIELRRYSVSAGCVDKMHCRMREVLLPLFAQHAVPSPFAIWANAGSSGPAMMTWMLRWPTLEVRNATWVSFRPIWEEAKLAQSEPEFVTRTDLTLIAPWPSHTLSFPRLPDACESGWIVQPQVGEGAAFRLSFADVLFPSFLAAGALCAAASDFVFGPLPQSLILVSWPDRKTRQDGEHQIARSLREAATGHGNGSAPIDDAWEQLDRAQYLNSWAFQP